MNIKDLKDIANKLKGRPISGRKLFIYCGNIGKIKEIIPKELLKEIDLLDFETNSVDSDENIVRKSFRKNLKLELENFLKTLEDQQVLIIKNAILFYRYKISIAPLYSHYLNDRTMCIIHLPKIVEIKKLPEYVICNSDEPINYFKDILPEEHKKNIIMED